MAASFAAAMLVAGLILRVAQARLVETPPLVLDYHNGPVLSGPGPINVYVIYYGRFPQADKSAIADFLSSFAPQSAPPTATDSNSTTVAQWWSLTRNYTDASGTGVAQRLLLAKALTDRRYSRGRSLQRADIAAIVAAGIGSRALPADPRGIYLVLTAADVQVNGFCRATCGEHLYDAVQPSGTSGGKNAPRDTIPYAWVGNSEAQCPGFCAWPYAKPQFGPQLALTPPNGVAVDGMIITIAKVLAGAATNPFGTAYYQGEQTFALEAAGACAASYGPGAYPGYPGDLAVDPATKASYNVVGANGRRFLVPWLWNPTTRLCAGKP